MVMIVAWIYSNGLIALFSRTFILPSNVAIVIIRMSLQYYYVFAMYVCIFCILIYLLYTYVLAVCLFLNRILMSLMYNYMFAVYLYVSSILMSLQYTYMFAVKLYTEVLLFFLSLFEFLVYFHEWKSHTIYHFTHIFMSESFISWKIKI